MLHTPLLACTLQLTILYKDFQPSDLAPASTAPLSHLSLVPDQPAENTIYRSGKQTLESRCISVSPHNTCCLCRPVRSLASDHIYAQQAKAMSSTAESTAVVVVDHGSRREASNRMLEDFVNLYRSVCYMLLHALNISKCRYAKHCSC